MYCRQFLAVLVSLWNGAAKAIIYAVTVVLEHFIDYFINPRVSTSCINVLEIRVSLCPSHIDTY